MLVGRSNPSPESALDMIIPIVCNIDWVFFFYRGAITSEDSKYFLLVVIHSEEESHR